MAADIDRIARRTLSRDERDPRPIDSRYHEALRQWLALYPHDTNFLVDLEAEELVVTCLDCFEDIGCGQGRGLLPFKMHLLNAHGNGAGATAHLVPGADTRSTTSASGSPVSVRSSAGNSTSGGESRRSSVGVKRSSSSFSGLEADSSSDAGSERKRVRLDSSFDVGNSSFGSYDGDDDISMPDLPADFWKPVDPRTIRSNQTTSSNRRTSASRLLAALDGASSSKVKLDPLPSKIKPEPVNVLIKPEPEDVKLFRDVSNVAGSSRPRASFWPEIKAEVKAELDTKPQIKPEPIPTSTIFARGLSLPSAQDDSDSEDESSFDLRFPQIPFPGPVLANGKGPNLTAFNDFFEQDVVNLAEAATVQTALQKLGLPDLNSKLPGSETRLYPHQVIGVSWMHDLEKNVARRGGILADDMGLGKTAQMIATMVINRPPKDQKRRSTLIIVPASLVGQWKLEIENMTVRDTFSIFIHHGNTKLRTVKQVAKYDIVITTYATLGQCFDKIERERGKKFDDYIEDETRRSGPLAKTLWWRVVLDEAQYARNRSTVASINIASLDSTHRWVLTGTPVTNALMDLYSFVRFLKYHPWSEFSEFNSRIGRIEKRNPQRAGERAQAMLAPIILRRNKDSKIEGEPIIKLGPKTITVRKIEFSVRERQIYDALEKRQQQKLQRIIERGRVTKEYQFILVMLLRLRQCANHPQLISKAASEFELNQLKTVEGLGANADPEFELERATILLGEEVVAEMKRKFMLWAKERASDEANDPEGTECCICLEPYMNNAMVTKCQHRFCDTCVFDIFETGEDGDGGEGAEQPGERPCPTCRTSLTKKHIFAAHAFEPTEDELEEAMDAERPQDDEDEDSDAEFRRINKAKTTRRAKGKGKAKAVDDEDYEEEGVVNGINLRELDLGKNFNPSAKMIKMVEFLKETEKNSPAERPDKTIIYSQWTSMIDMVQEVLRREKMANLRYDGSMNRALRDRTIQNFKSRAGPNILIISLKCGGVGLNLTEANHVISLDLAWNSATELQAFDRVHRLGQHLDVTIERLVVENTIEDRILAIQDKKQGLSDAALGEGRATRVKRFSVAELRRLFGMDH